MAVSADPVPAPQARASASFEWAYDDGTIAASEWELRADEDAAGLAEPPSRAASPPTRAPPTTSPPRPPATPDAPRVVALEPTSLTPALASASTSPPRSPAPPDAPAISQPAADAAARAAAARAAARWEDDAFFMLASTRPPRSLDVEEWLWACAPASAEDDAAAVRAERLHDAAADRARAAAADRAACEAIAAQLIAHARRTAPTADAAARASAAPSPPRRAASPPAHAGAPSPSEAALLRRVAAERAAATTAAVADERDERDAARALAQLIARLGAAFDPSDFELMLDDARSDCVSVASSGETQGYFGFDDECIHPALRVSLAERLLALSVRQRYGRANAAAAAASPEADERAAADCLSPLPRRPPPPCRPSSSRRGGPRAAGLRPLRPRAPDERRADDDARGTDGALLAPPARRPDAAAVSTRVAVPGMAAPNRRDAPPRAAQVERDAQPQARLAAARAGHAAAATAPLAAVDGGASIASALGPAAVVEVLVELFGGGADLLVLAEEEDGGWQPSHGPRRPAQLAVPRPEPEDAAPAREPREPPPAWSVAQLLAARVGREASARKYGGTRDDAAWWAALAKTVHQLC